MTDVLEPTRDADGVPLMVNGQRNPTGTGAYCAPRRCYCGRCPGWTPALPPNYSHALRQLTDAERGGRKKNRKDW